MTGQTIQQLKVEHAESLWQFLSSLPGSIQAQIFYAMLITGAVGMIANYARRWLQGNIGGSLISYLFRQHPKRTALSFFSAVGTGLAGIAAGAFETADGAFVGWFNVCWVGLTNGFTCDVIANKGDREQWTPEEREKKDKP